MVDVNFRFSQGPTGSEGEAEGAEHGTTSAQRTTQISPEIVAWLGRDVLAECGDIVTILGPLAPARLAQLKVEADELLEEARIEQDALDTRIPSLRFDFVRRMWGGGSVGLGQQSVVLGRKIKKLKMLSDNLRDHLTDSRSAVDAGGLIV